MYYYVILLAFLALKVGVTINPKVDGFGLNKVKNQFEMMGVGMG